jgi:hypothetical protein
MLLLKNGGIWMWNKLTSLFISHWRVEVFCWYIQLLAKDCEQHRPSKFSLWETISYGSRTSTRRLLDSAWAFWGCLCNKSKNEICLCHLSRKTLQLPPKAETCEHPSQPQHETEGFLFNLFHLFTTRCNQHLSDSLGYTNPPGFRTVSTSMCRWFHGVYDVYVST